jgi:HlyD family secretion protein
MKTRTLVILGAAAVAATTLAFVARGGTRPAPPPVLAQAPAGIRCEGRVAAYPGADVVVAAEYGGRLTQLAVHELDRVRPGQVLARLDSREQEANLAAARARLRQTEAEIRFLRLEQARQQRLLADGAVGQRSFDDADSRLNLSLAKRDADLAAIDQLRAAASKLTLIAPFGGTVVERLAQPGELLPAGGQLVRVADLARLRIEAEVDEYDIPRLRLGSPVALEIEGLPGSLRGRVEEIPASVSARRLKALDPARPSDIRVAMVKVAVAPDSGLKLGQRVELIIQ